MERQIRDLLRQKVIDSIATEAPSFTRRDVTLPQVPNKAHAIIGMRRSGKSTFLWQILKDRLDMGTTREGLLYLSFEDERLEGIKAQDLGLFVEEYYKLYPEWRAGRRPTFFLDEIQVVPGWETFVRRLMDTEKVDIFISGSSARLLSKDVATSMRGRALTTLVHPFSFQESLRHKGLELPKKTTPLTTAKRSALEKNLRDYLTAGGFPEAQGLTPRDRESLLLSYVDVALLRDVVERYAVSHIVALRWMIRQLLGNAAGSFSINKFSNDLHSQGVQVGKNTLHDYLAHLEDAFLVRTLFLDTNSERQRMVNPRKVYPVDPGLIPLFDRTGRTNLGHALETTVLIELERREAEIRYVITDEGHEVDFLARYRGSQSELIQVSVSIEDKSTREREIRALIEASRKHPKASKHLVTLEPASLKDIPHGIHHHLASDWLMGI